MRFGTEGSQARGLPDEAPTRFATPRRILAKRPFFFFFCASGFLTSSEPRSELPSLIVPVRESTSDSGAHFPEAPGNLICALGRAQGRRLEPDAARRPGRRSGRLSLRKRWRRRVRRLKCFQLLQRRVALGARGVVVRGYISLALGRVDRGGVARHFATVSRGAGVVAHVAVRRLGARRFYDATARCEVLWPTLHAQASSLLFRCGSSPANR